MKPLKSELKQLEQRREATIELLNQLLEELEGAPVQRRRHSWHPLGLLESAVNELVQALEGSVESMVVVGADKANRSRRG